MGNDTEIKRPDGLTDNEWRVYRGLVQGTPLNEIGRHLYLSPSTVSTYRRRILDKLKLETNADLVRLSERLRINGSLKAEGARA